jgi:hypothetical protein
LARGSNVVAGWSNLTQLQLCALLRSHGQPTGGSEAALAQRVAAFMSDVASLETTVDDGLLVGVEGDDHPNELYDEESGRCFQLPHTMLRP